MQRENSPAQPQQLQLTAWLLSTEIFLQRAFQKRLENYYPSPGDKAHGKIINVNSDSSIAGVIHNKLIRIQQL